jgi:hypothetical protein
MNKRVGFHTWKSFLVLVLCLISTSSIYALSEKNQQLVAQNLKKKLQSDLAQENVAVQLGSVSERVVSKSEVNLSGDAVCVLTVDDKQYPIRFEASVNIVNQSVSDVKYDFVPVASEYAPTPNEEILMQELMGKISRDYKTQNIVIAIDSFEEVGTKKFLGIGEIRIGDMVWNRIKFNVEINTQTQKADKIVYKLEK